MFIEADQEALTPRQERVLSLVNNHFRRVDGLFSQRTILAEALEQTAPSAWLKKHRQLANRARLLELHSARVLQIAANHGLLLQYLEREEKSYQHNEKKLLLLQKRWQLPSDSFLAPSDLADNPWLVSQKIHQLGFNPLLP